MADKNEYPEKYGWWISELNSLGVNTDGKEESSNVLGLENLTDDVKQNFIRDYKTHFSGEE
ncbi:MAG TPA: hypothetical protein VEP90_11695 [Methylomirabilota bacterium]|nr:hypothetical protein [Methylomirabilota bacterium]